MTLLYGLRMTADLAFYYAFAGFFAAFTGTTNSLPGILISAACFAVSAKLKDRKILRLAVLAPEIIAFLLPGSGIGDRVALIPVAVYTLYLAWTGNYALSHEKLRENFLLFCKVYPIFFVLITLLGGFGNLAAGSLPMALLMIACSVFLLRVLRHEPEVYRRPRFLLRSLLPLLLLLAAAWLLHYPAVLAALGAAVQAIYSVTLVPLLMGVTYVLAFLIMHILAPLMLLFRTEDSETALETAMESLTDDAAAATGSGNPLLTRIVQALGIILLIAAVALILLFLFRRLAGRRAEQAEGGIPTAERRTDQTAPAEAPGKRLPRSPWDPVNQVRRQYRRYLYLCAERGYTPHVSSTSQDIRRQTEGLFSDSVAADELRDLYIQARYHGTAAKEDAVNAREIVNRLRQDKAEK